MSAQDVKARGSDRWRNLIILVGLAALFALAYGLWPSFRSGIHRSISIVSRADIGQLRDYVHSFGVWAPIISASLMVLQSVLFPLPAFVITITNGLLFGAFWGTVLSWSSAMFGAIVCFYISRILGRPAVERLVSKKALLFADRFFERYGNNSVLIARLIPVISFDVVSYAAGATSITFLGFIVATGIGQLPATIVYSILGENIPKVASFGLVTFSAVAVLVVLGFTLKKAFGNRILKRSASNKVDEAKAGK